MPSAKVALPYFDALLEHLNLENSAVQKAFGRHVHWGYWANPATADGTVGDFAAAAEQLGQRVYTAAGVQDGNRVLDAGCGFGGTIASLNERFNDLHLVGLNIDPRQLERARQEVKPQHNNQIEFVEGNACELPFADASFDVVLAVECIFHFPSRADFFREAQRVLRPGGQFAICDFVPVSLFKPIRALITDMTTSAVKGTYGQVDSRFILADYQKLAEETGFTLALKQDITGNTLPTYPVVRRLFEQIGNAAAARATASVELVSRLGLLRYLILSFTKA